MQNRYIAGRVKYGFETELIILNVASIAASEQLAGGSAQLQQALVELAMRHCKRLLKLHATSYHYAV